MPEDSFDEIADMALRVVLSFAGLLLISAGIWVPVVWVVLAENPEILLVSLCVPVLAAVFFGLRRAFGNLF